MIRSVVEASLRFRLLVVGIAAGVMVLGVVQLRNAPVDTLPSSRRLMSKSRQRPSGFPPKK